MLVIGNGVAVNVHLTLGPKYTMGLKTTSNIKYGLEIKPVPGPAKSIAPCRLLLMRARLRTGLRVSDSQLCSRITRCTASAQVTR